MTTFRNSIILALRKNKKPPLDIQPLILKHCRLGTIADLYDEKVFEEEMGKRAIILYTDLPNLKKAGLIDYNENQFSHITHSQRTRDKEDLFPEGPFYVKLTDKGEKEFKNKWKDRNPFLAELRTLLITAALTLLGSILFYQYQRHKERQEQQLIDVRQDSAIKNLTESLRRIQSRK